ncbi:MAG: hypothetical protein JWO66_1376 [Candidatus Eremiobacteraeota bacterium]|nr:hypothetical protein [Candidatus Eremiobacteraeota bacterium]
MTATYQGAKVQMRRFLSLAAMLALAACGGGGGGSAPVTTPINNPTTAPQGGLVTPQFTIVFPAGGSKSSVARTPQRVSPATLSVTITFTNPPAGLQPTSVTTAITPASCPCAVNGPPSPPGVSDSYQIDTFDVNNGTGNNLDRGFVTFTPTAGQNNPQSVVLKGIPKTVTITGAAALAANTLSQTEALTVTAKDAAGQDITSGTYLNPITLSDPDTNGTQGTQLTGTNAGVCAGTCVVLNGPADTATLNYGGLAEDPVTLSATGSGVTTATTTFSPTLNAITLIAGGPTTSLGGGPGIDLFTTDNTSTVGYKGTISYSELGYTNPPYNKVLTTIAGTSCAAFATLAAVDTITSVPSRTGQTDFTATAIASPTAGSCSRVVSDGLAAASHGTGGPAFTVTYTTSSVSASSKKRH